MIRVFSNTKADSASVVFSKTNQADALMIDFIEFAESESATVENLDYIRDQLAIVLQ